MQGPTHLVMGMLIQKNLRNVGSHKLRCFLVAFLAVLSHGVLDCLARFTYHPSTPLFDDCFWVSYHVFIAFLIIFIFVKFWRKYKIGLIFSILPDVDWVVLNLCSFLSYKIPLWDEPLLHKIFFGLGDFLLSFVLSPLPNWSLWAEGAILEFTILAVLVTFFLYPQKETEKLNSAKRSPLTSDWISKLAIYIDCMDHEQSIRTAYQSLLTSLEVALLSLFFFLLELNLTDYLWIFFVLGMLLCPPFAIACEFHARNVDIWRIHIVELVKGPDVEQAFKDGKYRWIPMEKAGFWGEYFFGHWFERVLVFIILLIWWIIGLKFFPRPLTAAFAILVTLCWGVYVFRLIEPKGEIIPYLHRK